MENTNTQGFWIVNIFRRLFTPRPSGVHTPESLASKADISTGDWREINRKLAEIAAAAAAGKSAGEAALAEVLALRENEIDSLRKDHNHLRGTFDSNAESIKILEARLLKNLELSLDNFMDEIRNGQRVREDAINQALAAAETTIAEYLKNAQKKTHKK